jgi:uncharacterized protein (TIGR02246 family)
MQKDEQEIRQLVATWIAATKTGDIETVLSLMAEDVVFLLPGQPPMIGRAAFAAAMQAQSGQEPQQFDGTSEIAGDPRLWRLGLHVDQAHGRHHAARRGSANQARWAHPLDPQQTKRQVGHRARREPAVARVETGSERLTPPL